MERLQYGLHIMYVSNYIILYYIISSCNQTNWSFEEQCWVGALSTSAETINEKICNIIVKKFLWNSRTSL
jgi:hypothetical protein